MAYYKSPDFNPRAEVRINMRKQPAVDTGGVRRHFFAVVFENSKTFSLFEGPPEQLCPCFRMSNLSSGLFHIIGRTQSHP